MVQRLVSLLAAMAVIGGGATLATAQDSPVLDEGVVPHEGLDGIITALAKGTRNLMARP